MTKDQIKETYERMSKNFMTPKVREFVLTEDKRIVELAEGVGFDNKQIFGVTEFEVIDGVLSTTRRGQMHNTIMSARKHFNTLIK